MQSGDVVLGRFEVDRYAASGGMGDLYVAREQGTGRAVAIKTLHLDRATDRARFVREAKILAELQSPHVVRYIEHGETRSGQVLLVMEWLEGENLGARLARGRLGVAETLALGAQVAEALGEAHTLGIVHRDIKPGNIFLMGKGLAAKGFAGKGLVAPGGLDVKVLDFGLAWADDDGATMTRSGRVVGTFGYIAPELARGERNINPRADVFSLGCVLYECLTGRPPFRSRLPASTLMRVVYEDPPPLRTVRQDVPGPLAVLVHRMLSKDPAERPAHGAAVRAELDALAPIPPIALPRPSAAPALTASERRTIVFVLASLPQDAAQGFSQPQEVIGLAPELRAIAEQHGGRLELMIGPLVVVTLVGSQAATDLAARAVRCAMEVRRILPRVAMAIATGQGNASARVRAAAVLEMAGTLLETSANDAAAARGRSLQIRLDETTAGLLDMRFDIGGDERGLILRGEREIVDRRRTLLHSATPFVGRGREMKTLEAAFEACTREKVPRVILVTADAGGGKSRLRRQLRDRLRTRAPGCEIWLGFGRAQDGPLAGLARLLRSAANIGDDDAPLVRWQKLRARAARYVDDREVTRVSEFLAEVVAPRGAGVSAPLSAARQDGMLMAMQTRRALRDLVEAETSAGPLVIMLDDVHWMDPTTLDYVDQALRAARSGPLFIVAFGRDEARARIPARWAARHMRLPPLPEPAGAELARAVLGEELGDAQLATLVAHAGGNPFFLEELIRAFAAGRKEPPATVLAMVRSRIEALDPATRLVLRAASVFGERFEQEGLEALVGDPAQVSASLRVLVDAELVNRKKSGTPEFGFVHALVRDAAYAMLTPEDCALGHRLAARWLAEQPSAAPATVAEHHARGGEGTAAIPWYARAAEEALRSNEMSDALRLAEAGIAAGAEGDALTAVRLVKLEVDAWRSTPSEDWLRMADAMQVPLDSARGCRFAAVQATVRARLGDAEGLFAIAHRFLEVQPSAEARDAWLLGGSLIVLNLLRFGEIACTRKLLTRLGALFTDDPWTRAWIAVARARAAASIDADPWAQLEYATDALAGFKTTEDPRMTALSHAMAAEALVALGRPDEAERHGRDALTDTETLRLPVNAALTLLALASALVAGGKHDDARAAAVSALQAADATPVHQTIARVLLARALDGTGRREAALTAAREACALPVHAPARAEAQAVLASILLRGDAAEIAEARAVSREALAVLGTSAVGHMEGLVRVVAAEASLAAGAIDEARAIASDAAARLYERAARIPDEEARRTFLTRVPENARTAEIVASLAR